MATAALKSLGSSETKEGQSGEPTRTRTPRTRTPSRSGSSRLSPRIPTPQTPSASKRSLESVLNSSSELREFAAFCTRSQCEENILFWIDVEEFRLLPNSGFTASVARKICSKYVDENSRQKLPCALRHRDSILEQLDSPTAEMFSNLSWDAKDYLLDKSFPEFLYSNAFLENMALFPPEVKPTWSSLMGVLSNEKLRSVYRQFMECSGGYESDLFCLLFLEEIKSFTRLPQLDFIRRSAERIYSKYLSGTARLEVCIPPAIVSKIEQGIQDLVLLDLFNIAQKDVFHQIERDIFQRFLNQKNI